MKTKKKNTSVKINSDHSFMVDKLIDNIRLNTFRVYPKDREMRMGINSLLRHLKESPEDKVTIDLVRGLTGFIHWASSGHGRATSSEVLTNVIHDLGEFRQNKNEPWFCPRTSSYSKFL